MITFDSLAGALRDLFEARSERLRPLGELWAVRDLWGRVRFLVRRRPEPGTPEAGALEDLLLVAHERLGPHAYPPQQALLYRSELAGEADALEQAPGMELTPGLLRLVDRQVTGLSWATVSEPSRTESGPRRIAFYSLRGGVGRSTTVAVAAWHLAREGKSVLVVDLDLEAPGLSASLLPASSQPEFGIVDWFVEDAVGQGADVVERMTARSPLATDLPGEVWVVPAHGSAPGEFLAKLGRCYLDLPEEKLETWEQRLARLLQALETRHRPDAVLLDVRAGLPDLASVGVTELADEVLLFAAGTEQTWSGYRLLFEHWQRARVAVKIRERLKTVAALIPETDRDAYLSRFKQSCWDLFRESLYDQIDPGVEDSERFSFDLEDEAAPHFPLSVYWHRGWQSLVTLDMLDSQLVEAAYGRFLPGLASLLDAGVSDL